MKLDPNTGKLDWFYQETPHNIYDWDFQNSPIITKSEGKEVAIGSGKSGFVVAVDLKTGKPLWRTGSANTTATTRTRSTRCAANTARSRPAKSSPASSAA